MDVCSFCFQVSWFLNYLICSCIGSRCFWYMGLLDYWLLASSEARVVGSLQSWFIDVPSCTLHEPSIFHFPAFLISWCREFKKSRVLFPVLANHRLCGPMTRPMCSFPPKMFLWDIRYSRSPATSHDGKLNSWYICRFKGCTNKQWHPTIEFKIQATTLLTKKQGAV